jgi:hypothetical protein
MAPDPREAPVIPADMSVLLRVAERVAADQSPCERVEMVLEARDFGERHRRCAVLRSQRAAARAGLGTRVTTECLDCGDSLDIWIGPAAVATAASLS